MHSLREHAVAACVLGVLACLAWSSEWAAVPMWTLRRSWTAADELARVVEPVTELFAVPDAADFYRQFVVTSKPVVLRGANQHWRLLETLATGEAMSEHFGRAIVPVDVAEDSLFHVPQEHAGQIIRPVVVNMTLGALATVLVEYGGKTELCPGTLHQHAIEQASIPHVVPDMLGHMSPPSVAGMLNLTRHNLWMAPKGKLSVLHFDAYENLLCQVTGTKSVLLYPPIEMPYLYPASMHSVQRTDLCSQQFQLMNETVENFSRVQPLRPDLHRFPLFARAQPINVTIGPGDMLFLPAFWWHQVKSDGNAQGFNAAVNYWYTPHSMLAVDLFNMVLSEYLDDQ